MKILKSPVFIVCCLLFILHQILQRLLGISMPLVDQYLDMLLAMPIILTLILAERRILFRRGESYFLPVLDVVIATIFIALVSEVIFPALSDRFTADWLDVIFLIVGSLLFQLTINPSSSREV